MNTTSTPLVSIITPAYNSARYLEALLASVCQQDYSPIEHIVVDGGSTDRTVDLLRQAGQQVRWISEPDQGQSDALNKGLRLARGDIIGWINADDQYEPGAVAAAVGYLQAHHDVGLVFSDCNFIDAAGRVVDRGRTQATDLAALLLEGCTIPHQATFLRRSLFDRIGAFDVELRYVMDYDFLLRSLLEFHALRIDSVWGNLRVWEGTKTSQHPIEFWPEIIHVIERLGQAAHIDPTVRGEALRRARFRYGLAAAWAGEPNMAQRELVAACQDGPPYGSWAQAAEQVVEFCRRPSYVRVETAEADRLLELVNRAARVVPTLSAQLHAVRTFLAVQAGDWSSAGEQAGAALRASSLSRRNRGLWAVWAKSKAMGAMAASGRASQRGGPAA